MIIVLPSRVSGYNFAWYSVAWTKPQSSRLHLDYRGIFETMYNQQHYSVSCGYNMHNKFCEFSLLFQATQDAEEIYSTTIEPPSFSSTGKSGSIIFLTGV